VACKKGKTYLNSVDRKWMNTNMEHCRNESERRKPEVPGEF
jgi:hypothetical protein